MVDYPVIYRGQSSAECMQDVFYMLYDAPRRPQPDIERGAKVRHFRNRPSIFILAERSK